MGFIPFTRAIQNFKGHLWFRRGPQRIAEVSQVQSCQSYLAQAQQAGGDQQLIRRCLPTMAAGAGMSGQRADAALHGCPRLSGSANCLRVASLLKDQLGHLAIEAAS